MVFKRVIGLLALALSIRTGLSAAQQSTTETLRSLADKNNFYIGAAVYTHHLNNPVHSALLSSEFNMLTPENEAKASEVQPAPGRFNFTKFDELMKFAEDNHMTVRGHTLVWHQQIPNWLVTGPFTREEGIQALRDHIMTVVGRYKGRIAIWDVVNEAVNDNGQGLRDTPWKRWIGDDYVELAFQFAHEADPNALLFYNDYGAEGTNAKSNAIYAMVNGFVERGIPIHGVGLQAHFEVGGVRPDAIEKNMQRIGELGLQIQITEMDVRFHGKPTESILKLQAIDYRLLLETCLNNEHCTAFVTWGVGDTYTWLRGSNLGFFENAEVAPLMFDDDYRTKPAYFAVLDVLTQHAAGDE